MRGKNILWLSMIAMLLTVLVVNIGTGKEPEEALLRILPKEIPGRGELGHVGDEYKMVVEIRNVTNLWTVGFEIHIAPYASVLLASRFEEGPFLSEGWPPPGAVSGGTWFTVSVDALNGIIYVAITRYEARDLFGNPFPREGASGRGILMTFNLTVMEAGSSSIDIKNTIVLDPDLNPIPHNALGSKYLGSYARLRSAGTKVPRFVTAGDLFYLENEVENRGDVPLYVRVRWDIVRIEDGRRIQIRSGQTYGGGGLGEPLPFEYFYADEYIAVDPVFGSANDFWGGLGEWSNPGALIGPPDGVYSETTTAWTVTGWYKFEDLVLSGREVQNIDLEGFTRQPDGVDNDFDPFILVLGPDGEWRLAWCDSMGGSPTWAWTGGRYYQGGPYDMPEYYRAGRDAHLEESFNSMMLFIENYGVDGPRMQIDSIRWKVEFAAITPSTPPVYIVQPGEKLVLDPVTWPSTADHIGSYEVTATIEYSASLVYWNFWEAKQKTFWLVIQP